ncbi:MAG TPA: phosphotransferase [Ktedonobacteraceae bacterium]|jgi:spectinomycin phosphotransferase|nr:phosphotransferase [Ktedonobacteraceae bacterium]
MREQLKISEERLQACLQNQYGLYPITLEYLPIGLDYNAGIYRVTSEQGTAYLLKATSRPLYEPASLIPHYLNEQGITSVVAPIPTTNGNLWTQLEGWTLIVYPFLEGDTSWTGMTDEQWKEVGTIFQRIHKVNLPSSGFNSLRKETFDPTEYVQWARNFEAQHLKAVNTETSSKRVLRSSWLEHQPTIHAVVTALENLSRILRSRMLSYVICHADLHPANLLRNQRGQVCVIDWDEVMLAPKERDFIFIQLSPDDSRLLPGTPAFFQGYGDTEIDWVALTYYRYERAMQDLIACAQEVFFRDDLGEDTKADSVRLFQSILAEGGEIEATSQASAHLPFDLAFPTRMVSGIDKELAEREQPDA